MNKITTNVTNFGIKPASGLKLCGHCHFTIPLKGFYAKDINDPSACCKDCIKKNNPKTKLTLNKGK